jgi:small subunit ribosomal protein S7
MRKNQAPKRKILEDPIYHSVLVSKLINVIMLDGKKGTSQGIVYGAFDRIEKQTKRNPYEVFIEAIDQIKPRLETKSKRVGGQNQQVPVIVRDERQLTLALRWLITYSRKRKEKTMEERLAREISDAANGQGESVKKRENTLKMAESNRAFAHNTFK